MAIDLTQSGQWLLGNDRTQDIIAAMVRDLGGVSYQQADITFNAGDELLYQFVSGTMRLTLSPAPTTPQIDAALTAVGIAPATATAEQRALMSSLLRTLP